MHQRGDDLLRRHRRRAARSPPSRCCATSVSAQLAQHPGGLGGLVGATRPRAIRRPVSSRSRRLRDQPALVHHPDMGADLLDLGEQVGGEQHRGALVGERRDQLPHLAGALRVEPVGGLVEDQQVARGRAGRRPRPAAAACRASRRGSACRRRRSARPGPGPRRSVRSPWPGRRCGRPRRAGAGSPCRTGTGGTPAPRPARRPGAGPPPRRPASARRAARARRRSAGSGRAASGWWWSCRNRSGRESRSTAPRGTARSTASTATWRPKRLVSPAGARRPGRSFRHARATSYSRSA